MKKFFTIIITLTALTFATIAISQTTSREGRPAAPSTTLKLPAPDNSEFFCTGGKNGSYCSCSGVDDCLTLKSSGKCTGNLDVSKDGKSAKCDTDSAGQTAGTGASLKARTETRTGGNIQGSNRLAIITPDNSDPTEYICTYGKNGKKKNCGCNGIQDCLDLQESGLCKGGIKTEGSAGLCKAKN